MTPTAFHSFALPKGADVDYLVRRPWLCATIKAAVRHYRNILRGRFDLCCLDAAALAAFRAAGLADIYSTVHVLPAWRSNIDREVYWAAVKQQALLEFTGAVLAVDLDAVVWEPFWERSPDAVQPLIEEPVTWPAYADDYTKLLGCLDDSLQSDTLRREAMRPGRLAHSFKGQAFNTSICYFPESANFRLTYANIVLNFMALSTTRRCYGRLYDGHEGSPVRFAETMFAEQRLLPMLAVGMDQEILPISSTKNPPVGFVHNAAMHLWIAKFRIKDQAAYCRAVQRGNRRELAEMLEVPYLES